MKCCDKLLEWERKPRQAEAVTCTCSLEKCPFSHSPNLKAVGVAVLSKVFINKLLLHALRVMPETL